MKYLLYLLLFVGFVGVACDGVSISTVTPTPKNTEIVPVPTKQPLKVEITKRVQETPILVMGEVVCEVVAESALNFRDCGDVSCKILDTLRKGDTIVFIRSVNGWVETEIGWANEMYLVCK